MTEVITDMGYKTQCVNRPLIAEKKAIVFRVHVPLIQGFPEVGAPTLQRAQTYDFAKIS